MSERRGAPIFELLKRHGIFLLCIRLFLGILFIYAGIDKIIHPAAFAKAVYNYQILPDFLINLAAIVLPWLELIIGVFLILRLWLPGAVLLSNILLAAFFGALVFNMARGLDIKCGCFGLAESSASGAPMGWYVVRDGIFLLLSFYLFSRTFRGELQTADGQHVRLSIRK